MCRKAMFQTGGFNETQKPVLAGTGVEMIRMRDWLLSWEREQEERWERNHLAAGTAKEKRR